MAVTIKNNNNAYKFNDLDAHELFVFEDRRVYYNAYEKLTANTFRNIVSRYICGIAGCPERVLKVEITDITVNII